MDEAGVSEGSKMMILTKAELLQVAPYLEAPLCRHHPLLALPRQPCLSVRWCPTKQLHQQPLPPLRVQAVASTPSYSAPDYHAGPEWTSRPAATSQSAGGTRLGGSQAGLPILERRGVCYGPRQVLRAVGHGICAIPAAVRYVGSVLYLAMVHPRTGFGVRFLSGFTAFYALWPISFMPARVPAHGFFPMSCCSLPWTSS